MSHTSRSAQYPANVFLTNSHASSRSDPALKEGTGKESHASSIERDIAERPAYTRQNESLCPHLVGQRFFIGHLNLAA